MDDNLREKNGVDRTSRNTRVTFIIERKVKGKSKKNKDKTKTIKNKSVWIYEKYYIENCRIVAMDRYNQANISLLQKVYVYIRMLLNSQFRNFVGFTSLCIKIN